MQKDSAQAEISLKVVGGLLFLTHPKRRRRGQVGPGHVPPKIQEKYFVQAIIM